MISRIKGTIVGIDKDRCQIEVDLANGLVYQVYVSPDLLSRVSLEDEISLFTYLYMQNEPSKTILILIGFSSPIEREFFELFTTVSGIGPKAALRAFSKPVSEIATAIAEGDEKYLCSLPGIGRQRARQIIAKLQDKIAKFALLKPTQAKQKERETKEEDIFQEAYEILIQLQYRKSEARQMIEKIKSLDRSFESVEEVLEEIYRRR